MEKILGIDTGTNSLGWAIVEKYDEGSYNLLDKGSNIFTEGVKIEKGIESSKAAERTEHRASRVRYYRLRLRKIELLRLLSENHLCPPVSNEELSKWRLKKIYPENELLLSWESTDDNLNDNPYYYRYKCVNEKLDLSDLTQRYMLGRALYHIIQRRGFLSNRKSKEESDDGVVKLGISDLSKEMELAGCKYLGEYFYKLYLKGEKIRNHYTAREEHYLNEFNAICVKQELDDELVNKLKKAIFFQRPLKSQKGVVGHCLFEPKKAKCPVSHPAFEEFRMLSFINNIKIQTPSDIELRPLNEEERQKISGKFYRKSKSDFEFKEIAEELAGKKKYAYYKKPEGKPYLFNYYMDTTVSGCPVTACLRNIFGDNWLEAVSEVYDKASGKTSVQILNDIWHVLFDFSDKSKLKEFAINHLQLDAADAEKFSAIKVPSGYAALSLKAINNILPYLRMGMKYSHAVFFGKLCDIVPKDVWNNEESRNNLIDELCSVIEGQETSAAETRTLAQCISDHLQYRFNLSDKEIAKLYHPSMLESYVHVPEGVNKLGSPRINSVRNPMAMRSMFRMRHVINTLLAENKIDRNTTIHIEFARELNDANKRQALAHIARDNEKERNKCKAEIEATIKEDKGIIYEATDRDILKYQLWEEQDHKCIYTGRNISVSQFIGDNPEFDIEHTIPRSVGGDSAKMNLTLCESRFNRDIKKTSLPANLSNGEEILERISGWKEKYEDLSKQVRRLKTNPSMDKNAKDRIIQKRHYLQMQSDYWYGKYHRFEMTDVPEGFSRRQGADISVISKYGRLFLKSFFNRVFVVKGLATSDFRKIWGIQDIYTKKARVNHIHHCIDAIVIACMGPGEYAKLAQYYHDEEQHEWYGSTKAKFIKPWPTFTEDIKNVQDEVLIAHSSSDNMAKQGRRRIRINGKKVLACGDAARASLHLDTYYGAIEQNGDIKYVVRKTLDANFKESDVKNIVDDTVREKVEAAIKEAAGLKNAIADTIWMNKEKGIAIKKVRCFTPSVTRPLNIRHHRDVSPKEYKQQFHVANDSNYAMAIYIGKDKKGKEKRTFERLTNLQAAEYFKKSNDKILVDYNYFPLIKNDLPLAYILKIGTRVLLYENSPEELYDCSKLELVKRLYKVSGLSLMDFTTRVYGVVNLLHHQEARPSGEVKGKNGAYKQGEEFRPKIIMLHGQIRALVEGYDFTINDLGEVKMKG